MDLSTSRLRLRRWRAADREPFAAMNADPVVMEYFPDRLTREQSDDLIEKIEAGFDANGFGLWALQVKSTGELVGFTGLAKPSFRPTSPQR
jgi:ribosomal-protein-alanine N-acetyltransferase